MKAAIYSRKSKFTGKGDSIGNQIEMCSNHAKNLGINDFAIYEDEGHSGKNTARPRFQAMLQDARDKNFDIIICYRLDRISRSVSDFSTLLEELNNLGISFISVREQFDTSTAMGKAMLYISSVFAQLERETIAERIKDNMYELARNGRWLGGPPPLGYKSVSEKFIDKDKERKRTNLIVDQNESDKVKFIFATYLRVRSTQKTIKILAENGITGKNDIPIKKGTIINILRNPVYVKATDEVVKYLNEVENITVVGEPNDLNGILTYSKHKGSVQKDKDKWIASIGPHEGILDSYTWLETQKILSSNAEKAPRSGTSRTALLSGFIKCKCGYAMRVKYGVKRKDDTKPAYYACTVKETEGISVCDNKNIRIEEIESAIIENLKTIDKATLLKEMPSIADDTSNNSAEIEYIKKSIADKETAISNLVKQLSLLSDDSSKYVIGEIDKLSSDVAVMKKNLDSMTQSSKKASNKILDVDLILENVNKFNSLIGSASLDEQRFILSNIISKVVWDSDEGEVKVHYVGS